MAHKVTIEVESLYHDRVSRYIGKTDAEIKKLKKDAAETAKELDKLGKKKAAPTVSATDKISAKLAKIQARTDKLGKTKVSAAIGAVDKATQTIGGVIAKAKSFAGSIYTGVVSVDGEAATGTLGNVIAKGREIGGKTWRAAVSIKDYATAPLKGIKNMLFNIKTLAAGIVAGAVTQQVILDPVNTADSIESSRIAFENKLGSSDKAEEFLQSIYKFDEKSPFDTMQIVGIAQQMMNVGWEADNVLGDLGTIGDWAASMGKGEEGIQSVTRALGQMRQKGKLSAEEMLQLTEAGVSGWDYLAKYLGKTIPEVREMSEDGEIDVNTAIKGILAGMKEFEGSAAATSDRTVSGIMDQVKSLFNTYIKLPWGEGLASGFKDGLGEVRDLLDENKDKFKEWGESLKEVGTAISTFLADKVKGALATIEDITGSDAFKNADAGGKIGMLWDGLVADPLAEWWDGKGRQAMQDKAVELGMSIGEGILKGMMSFISNHPIASLLLAGHMGLKAAGGGSALGGLGKLAMNLGSAASGTGILGMGSNIAIAMGAGNLAGGASLGAGALSALGLGAAAGGIAGGVTLGTGIYDLYQGYKNDDTAKKKSGGWKVGGVAAGAAAGAALGSIIPGLGTAVGGLIGAGVGGIAGWIKGKKAADEYTESVGKASEKTAEQAKKERELAQSSLDKHFGKMALSADEVSTAVEGIIGSDKMAKFSKMQTVLENATTAYTNMEQAGQALEKNMWYATINRNAKLSKDEMNNLKESVKNYTDSAKDYMTESQYASSQSITNLMGNSKAAKGVIEASTKYYEKQQKELEKLSKSYDDELNKALADGKITVDEQASLDEIRQKIANITAQLNKEQQEKELNLLKFRLSGEVDVESFTSVLSEAQKKNKELQKQYEEEFAQGSVGLKEGSKEWLDLQGGTYNQIGNLHLSTGNFGFDKIKETYKSELGILTKDLETLSKEYNISDIVSKVGELDESDRAAIGQMVEAMAPTTEEIGKLKGQYDTLIAAYEEAGIEVPKTVQEGYNKINEYLANADFLEALSKGPEAVQKFLEENETYEWNPEVTGEPKTNAGETADKVKQETESALDEKLAERIEKEVGVDITGNKNIMNTIEVLQEDFGVPEEKAAYIAMLLSGDKEIMNHVDVLAEEFGIPKEQAETVMNKLRGAKTIENKLAILASEFGVKDLSETIGIDITGSKSIMNSVTVTAGDFGIPDSITKTVSVFLKGTKKFFENNKGSKRQVFRGGLIGEDIPGYSAGGEVRGGAQVITVAEEGDPEMIIPLSQRRRDRALALWEKTGEILGADRRRKKGFATGGNTNGDTSAPKSFLRQSEAISGAPGGSGSTTVQVNVGGVTIEVKGDGSGDAAKAISQNHKEIAEQVAAIFNEVFKAQFENMPAKG